jgi:ketosteroid isomerase-like protein
VLRVRDIYAIMSLYAPDIILFDILPPLKHKGHEEYRKIWDMCFPSFRGPIDCESRDRSITAGDGAAFSHGIYRFCGTMTDGKKMDIWVRAANCYRKVDGRWLIAHEHHSVPVSMETNQALFDPKP